PADDSEFALAVTGRELSAGPGSPAFGRMDLLTVVEHELGHVLGLEDLDAQISPHELMTDTLAAGVRRSPSLAGAFTVPLTMSESPATRPGSKFALKPRDRGVMADDFAGVLPGVPLFRDAEWFGTGPGVRIGDDRANGLRAGAGPSMADLAPDLDRSVPSPPEVHGRGL